MSNEANPEPSFAPTESTAPVARNFATPAPPPPPEQKPRVSAVAARALREVLLKSRTAAAKFLAHARHSRLLKPEYRGRASLVGLIVLLAAALAWRSVNDQPTADDDRQPPVSITGASRGAVEDAVKRGDSVTVLALLAEDDSAPALLLRADAAAKVGRVAETFDLLERAGRVDASVRNDPAFIRGAVASLTVISSTRVASLLRDTPDELVTGPLEAALRSADYRQRHGAQYVLAQRGHKVDDTPLLYLDLLQLSDCDARVAVAKTLLRRADTEPSVEHVVRFAKSRDREGCLSGVGPKRTQASR